MGGLGTSTLIGDDEDPGTIDPVKWGGTVTQIAVGDGNSCALLATGDVRCTGASTRGELGYGNTTMIGASAATLPDTAGPVQLGTGRTAARIAMGEGYHTCAILDNGALRCWGFNLRGGLGLGNTNTIGDNEHPGSVPTVSLGTGRTAARVSSGLYFTCVILDDGNVRCWGQNADGQLGLGNTTQIGDDELPTAVGTVNLGAGRTATRIATGQYHACVIMDDGNVRCWGRGLDGRLGYGNVTSVGMTPATTPDTAGPVALGAGRKAIDIAAGADFTCVILDDGKVRCWGDNTYGKLGLGNTNDLGDNELPTAAATVNLGTGRTATQLAAGRDHMCAVLDNGRVLCWGRGVGGMLGNKNTTDVGDNETPGSRPTINLGEGPAAATVTPASSALGSRLVGATGTPVTVTVRSTGDSSVRATSITLTGDTGQFTLNRGDGTGGTCGTTPVIEPSKTCTVTVTHTPTTAGSHSVTINVVGNATAGSTALTATATAPPPAGGQDSGTTKPDTPGSNTPTPGSNTPSTPATGTQEPAVNSRATVMPLGTVTPLVRTASGATFSMTTRAAGRIVVFVVTETDARVPLARGSVICGRTRARTLYAAAFAAPRAGYTCRFALRFATKVPRTSRMRMVIGRPGEPLANLVLPTPVPAR